MLPHFFRFHLPAILWAIVVAVLTLLPSDKMPETPNWELLSFDTLAHAGVFALLTFLVARSFYFEYEKPRFLKFALLVALVLCTFFGIIIELLQTVMNLGRHGETGDAISDFIGAVFGVLFCFFYFPEKSGFLIWVKFFEICNINSNKSFILLCLFNFYSGSPCPLSDISFLFYSFYFSA